VVLVLFAVRGAGNVGLLFCGLPQRLLGLAGTLVLTIFAAVAEQERGLIGQ
jgi:hypothetical protein